MDTSSSSFFRLLEQYALKVTSHFIDSADSATQSQMIDMIRGIDCSSAIDKTNNNQADIAIGCQQEELEWQQVLSQPIDWSSVHRQWVIDRIGKLMKRNELRIHQLERALSDAEHRYTKIQMTFWLEPRRTQLLGWYESLLEKYDNQLKQSRSVQQHCLEELHQLQG